MSSNNLKQKPIFGINGDEFRRGTRVWVSPQAGLAFYAASVIDGEADIVGGGFVVVQFDNPGDLPESHRTLAAENAGKYTIDVRRPRADIDAVIRADVGALSAAA